MDEKELVENYINARQNKEAIDQQLDLAKEALSLAQEKIIAYLADRGQNRSGSYEGLGSITLKSFNTYKVDEQNQDKLVSFIKENGLDGIIKQSIHHKTLDRVLNELIEEGKAIPDFVNSYNITTVQLNKG